MMWSFRRCLSSWFYQGPRIFISYRRADAGEIANRICEHLRREFEFGSSERNVFLDIQAIPPGDDFRELTAAEVASSDVLLVMIGTQWLRMAHPEGHPRAGKRRLDDEDDPVRIEVAAGLEGYPDAPRVIPVLINGASMPQAHELPSDLQQLSNINAAVINSGRYFQQDMESLIKTILLPCRVRRRTFWRAILLLCVVVALSFLIYGWIDPLPPVEPTDSAALLSSPTIPPTTTAILSGRSPVVYSLIQAGLDMERVCPIDPGEARWAEFRNDLSQLNLTALDVAERQSVQNFQQVFARLLDTPPSTEADCEAPVREVQEGYRKVMVVFEVDAATAESEGYTQLAPEIGRVLDTTRLQFLYDGGVNLGALATAPVEVQRLVEYFEVWSILFVEGDSASDLLTPQTVLLALSADDIADSDLRSGFERLHQTLLRLSHAYVTGDSSGVYAGRSFPQFCNVLGSVSPSDDQLRRIGGDDIVELVASIRSQCV